MKVCIAALLVVGSLSAPGQSVTNLSRGYYVVVASYRANQETYASGYAGKLSTDGRHASYGFDPARRFYHVYLQQYSDFNESLREMLKARKDGFSTAWVRIIKDGSEASVAEHQPSPEKQSAASKPDKPQELQQPAIATQPVATPAVAPETPVESNPAPADVVQVAPAMEEAEATALANDPFIRPRLLREKEVVMVLFNPTNNAQVDGDVEIVDADRTRLLARVKSGTPVLLPDPRNNSGKILLKASSFGYRPIDHQLDYKIGEKDSVPDFIDVNDGHYQLRFEMIRLHRGDIAVLYNVYFYNDAAVMIPDSKYELNKLLELMNSNKNYRIRLHGHTNGNGQGKIISLGESKNFFSLNADVKQGFGSAKELSKQRAETIRDWLISQNVASDRIEVQAHGGSRMIHDKNSANAKRNVRVEVEMLSE